MRSDHGLDFIMPKWDWSFPSIRRYLGLNDPGPLDTEIELDHRGETKRHPIWKWFRLLAREEVDEHTLKRALTDALSPAEIVDLGRDASFMVYATRDEGDDDPSPRSTLLRDLIDEHGAEADAADVDAIRFTLDMIGKGDMWKLRDEGWEGALRADNQRGLELGDETAVRLRDHGAGADRAAGSPRPHVHRVSAHPRRHGAAWVLGAGGRGAARRPVRQR
jgi:hypothetical protein